MMLILPSTLALAAVNKRAHEPERRVGPGGHEWPYRTTSPTSWAPRLRSLSSVSFMSSTVNMTRRKPRAFTGAFR